MPELAGVLHGVPAPPERVPSTWRRACTPIKLHADGDPTPTHLQTQDARLAGLVEEDLGMVEDE
jgi:hypothetical protein